MKIEFFGDNDMPTHGTASIMWLDDGVVVKTDALRDTTRPLEDKGHSKPPIDKEGI